ncbi:MAG TPA: proline iminopeptidase-family hydrolase [Ktedonobacteraceae bacterium]|nr:proline iminopeptidase-family hydrolase [Ktedonobacteraceae bacterium]
MSIHEEEGFVPVEDGYRVWYRSVGGGGEHERIPLLLLHGGPGAPHDYLENLSALASEARRVIFYDQLGCGQSDKPDESVIRQWGVQRFVDELATMCRELGLDRVHILGQSWGGMLAIEYALTQPQGLVSLILSNTTSSIPLWVAEANRLRSELPPEVNATLLRHEEAGTTDSAEYQEAMMVFYERHVVRVNPMPDYVQRAFDNMSAVYYIMNGPSEFHVTGTIKDWDRTDRLSEIRVPTLIISGEYDEATPVINEVIHKGIPGSEWVMLENCSHISSAEDPERYMQLVQNFLRRVEEA